MAGEKTGRAADRARKPVMVDGLRRARSTSHPLAPTSRIKDASSPRKRRRKIRAHRRSPVPPTRSTTNFHDALSQARDRVVASASATTTSTPNGPARTASSSPTRRTCSTEEVADTALGLLLCTVREFPQAERYLRAGKWPQKALSAQQGDAARPHRRHGRHGPHRPGDRAPARGHAACRWSITRARSAGGRVVPALSEAHRHGARRRHAAGDHARAAPRPRT